MALSCQPRAAMSASVSTPRCTWSLSPMLERIRESSKSGLTMIVFAIIMVVFAFSFGAPSDGCQANSGPKYLATVHGEDIESDELGMVYNRTGRSQNDSDAQAITKRAHTLKGLILIHLLAEEAKKMGLAVSDEDLASYLKSPVRNAEFMPGYGRTGKLNGTYFNRYIENQLRVSVAQYQDFKRVELLARKYMELVEMQLAATPAEIAAVEAIQNDQIKLDFVKLSPKALAPFTTITDEELDAFIVSDAAAVKAQYDADKTDKYTKPKEYQLRRLYMLAKTDATDEDRKVMQDKFEEAIKEIEGGADLGEVATKYGDDIYGKERKGLMGWNKKEFLPDEIVNEIDALKKGDAKRIVSPSAMTYYKLEDVREEEITPMADVQKDIARAMLQEKKSKTLITTLSDRIKAELATTKDLKKAIENIKKIEVPQTAVTPEDDATEKDDDTAKDDQDKAPDAPTSPWSAVSVADTGFFTKEGPDMSEMRKRFNFPLGVSIGGRWDTLNGIGKSPEIVIDAFKMSKDTPVKTTPYTIDEDLVFVQLAERKMVEQEDADEASMNLSAQLRSQKSNVLIRDWQALFSAPKETYGPWLEDLYKNAYKSGELRLSTRNKSALQLKQGLDGEASTSPTTIAVPPVTTGKPAKK